MSYLQSCNDHQTLDNFPKQYLQAQAKGWLQLMQNIQISFIGALPGPELSNPVRATSSTGWLRNLSTYSKVEA